MPVQNRIIIDRNIKQDTNNKKYYVTFYHSKDDAGNAKRKTKTFDDLNDAKIALKTHELIGGFRRAEPHGFERRH